MPLATGRDPEEAIVEIHVLPPEEERLALTPHPVEYAAQDFYASMYDGGDLLQISPLYPVLVVEGELYIVQAAQKPVGIKRVGHVTYHRPTFVKGHARNAIIDVVSEQYFPRWLSRIEREMDVMSDRIRNDYDSIRRLTDEWVKDYRQRMGRNVTSLSKPEAET